MQVSIVYIHLVWTTSKIFYIRRGQCQTGKTPCTLKWQLSSCVSWIFTSQWYI